MARLEADMDLPYIVGLGLLTLRLLQEFGAENYLIWRDEPQP